MKCFIHAIRLRRVESMKTRRREPLRQRWQVICEILDGRGKDSFTILQGEDMGVASRLFVRFSPKVGESVAVSGEVRHISDDE